MEDMKDLLIYILGIVVISQLIGRLFNLGLHAEHHQSASKHYPLLSQEEKAIEMPTNYSIMLIMALIPPLWFL